MSQAGYGFDAAKFRAARREAGASVARIARGAGVTERAVSLYLAGTRTPRPEVLPRLAAAVGAAPADLCTVEHECLVHLRVYTGRSRAAMAQALGMTEETYRQVEVTGHRGRAATSRYDGRLDRYIAWEEWAAPAYGVSPQRLAEAEQHTRQAWQELRAERQRAWLEQLDQVERARLERLGRRGRRARGEGAVRPPDAGR
ncbi:helix-turn-helix transcriptional regulator [Kitasatospora herbaricolor]|uniref:Helix-turn-helix domain-containing protein n=1 Tax=Kitasatospora herbaricolor TaxID=68217 RepID=A0ABZ1WM49_9ACTN|nr:helix-turn-helix transcriptional regulator [Kitasatospora herbaricolor]